MTKLSRSNWQLPIKINLSVLGYEEDGLHVAHCLEMDLKGRGESNEEALEDLLDLIRMQITFALEKGEPGLIYHPAESKYFRAHQMLRRTVLQSYPENPSYGGKYLLNEIPMAEIDREVRKSRGWGTSAHRG